MSWFDVGVNVTDKRLIKRVDDVLEQASLAQVNHLLTIGTSLTDSYSNAEIAERYSKASLSIHCTAGFHPHNAKAAQPGDMEKLEALFEHPHVVAIGECGLDFNRNFSPPDTQLKVFEQQLILASDSQLPVYLHERDAFNEQIALLKKYRKHLSGGLVHCFTGNREQLEQYLALDLYVGITGWVCDPERGQDLRDALSVLPLDRLLLETDAPYLAPKEVRPRPKYNQPSLLPEIAKTVADIKNVELETLRAHSFDNACKLFYQGGLNI